MRLDEKEYYEFFSLYQPLIYFAGQQAKIVAKTTDFRTWQKQGNSDDKFPCRQALIKNKQYINQFISENPFDFSEEKLNLIKPFNQILEDNFILHHYTPDYTAFLHTGHIAAYGVHALNEPLHLFFDGHFPVLVRTALLPFRGKIVYDGYIQSHPYSATQGFEPMIENLFHHASNKYGIITKFPLKR